MEVFLALRRKLRRLFTVALADDDAAPLASAALGLEESSGSANREEGGASPDAASAASIPDKREVLDNSPETRGRR